MLQKMPESNSAETVLDIQVKIEMMAILVIQTDVLSLVLLKLGIFEQEGMKMVLTLALNAQMGYLLMLIQLYVKLNVEMEKNMQANNEMMGMLNLMMVAVIHVP